jgi:hypothetical protein
VLITIVLIGHAIWFVPYLKMAREDRTDPEYRREDIDNWHGLVGGPTGLDADAFAAVVREGLWAYKKTLDALRAPFRPFFRVTDTSQQWGLFAIVTQRPDHLVIEVRRAGDWEILYRRLDPDHDWRDAMLKYRRVRGVWDSVEGDEPKGTYKRFSVWVAKEIFREQPDVDRVRVVLERRRVTWPWQAVDPSVTRRAERSHKRENHPL